MKTIIFCRLFSRFRIDPCLSGILSCSNSLPIFNLSAFTRIVQCYFVFVLCLFIIACNDESGAVSPADKAINAVNVLDKGSYKALAENRGKEPVKFEVVDNIAYMKGVMDSTIPLLVENLIEHYPQINTIVMTEVMGTIDFEATLEAGRLVREACLKTVVPFMGKIASGGVHFFLGGCERIIENGGKLGVHTWKTIVLDDDGNIKQSWVANDYVKDDPVHSPYLNYQDAMGISEEFYWTMIDIPFENYRFLSEQEITEFNISTLAKKSWGANYRLAIDNEAQLTWKSARFYVDKNIAVMHGKISSRTRNDLYEMLADHPEVNTLEFGYVIGTLDSNGHSAIDLGYTIRSYCLTTSITALSYVLAEGVDAYLSGCKRDYEVGGRLGMLSRTYSTSIRDDLDDLHAARLKYYADIGVHSSFYSYQQSFNKEELYFIRRVELVQFGIVEDL